MPGAPRRNAVAVRQTGVAESIMTSLSPAVTGVVIGHPAGEKDAAEARRVSGRGGRLHLYGLGGCVGLLKEPKMMKRYEVIVRRYTSGAGRDIAWGLDLRVVEWVLAYQEVLRLAAPYCRPGFCVIVRPEQLGPEEGVYEWRSFDGEDLRKVTF